MRCRVCLVRENNQPQPMAIKTADMAYELVKEELGSADREMMLSILLTGNLRLVGVETVAIGSQNMVGASNRRNVQERHFGQCQCRHPLPQPPIR